MCSLGREFSYFFRGVGLGVENVHHCHRQVRELSHHFTGFMPDKIDLSGLAKQVET